MKPRFKIRFEKNHPDGVILIPKNIPAAKMQRENLFSGVSSSSLFPVGSYQNRPSNKFYETQFEYHGTFK